MMQYLRKQYMDQLIRKKDNGRIKIITDLRRSGKSCLLFNLYRKYLSIILRKNIKLPQPCRLGELCVICGMASGNTTSSERQRAFIDLY